MIATLHDAVLQVLTYVVPFLGILMAIVFVHELGHFLAGRWCGIEVKTFSLGFGRVLWSFHDRHGTRWQLAAIPLGGYVKFAEDSNAASVATGKQPSPGSAGGAFHNSALWKRVVVVAAGPLANFVFAALIYALLNFAFGSREFPSRIGSVAPDSPAARAGLKAGDVITAIDGSRVVHFRDVERLIEAAGTNLITVTAERAGKTIAVDVTPRMGEKACRAWRQGESRRDRHQALRAHAGRQRTGRVPGCESRHQGRRPHYCRGRSCGRQLRRSRRDHLQECRQAAQAERRARRHDASDFRHAHPVASQGRERQDRRPGPARRRCRAPRSPPVGVDRLRRARPPRNRRQHRTNDVRHPRPLHLKERNRADGRPDP